MASDIVLSSALRNNLLSLQQTQRSIDTTQFRLATGKKVNSALDNPASFFAAQSLSNRASDLTRLLDGINQSIRTIEAADKGVTALTSLIEQAQSIAQDAQDENNAAEGLAVVRGTRDLSGITDLVTQSGGTIANGDDIGITVWRRGTTAAAPIAQLSVNIATGDNIYDIAGTINSTAALAPYVRAEVDANGRFTLRSLEEGAVIRLSDSTANGAVSIGNDGYNFLGLDGFVGQENNGVRNPAPVVRQGATAIAGRIISSQQALATSAVNGVYLAGAELGTGVGGAGFIANFAAAGGDDLTIQIDVDGVTTTVGSYINTNSIQEVIDDINILGNGVTARFNTSNGRIELVAADSVGTVELIFTTDDPTSAGDIAFGFGSGITGFGAVGGNSTTDVTIANNANFNAVSERFVLTGSSANLVQFQDNYNSLLDQIDDLVNDASYRGINLLDSDNLTTFFNEDRTSSLVTEGVDFTAFGLNLDDVDYTNAVEIQQSIDATRAALESVRNFGRTLANDISVIQTRRDFTESVISTLKAGADDLVVADQNEEGANLLALQTRQQLGVTSLALASQSQQSVLRLF